MVEVYKIVKLMNRLKRDYLFALFASKINEALMKAIWSQVQSKQKDKVHYTAFLKTIIAVAGRILGVTHVCTVFTFPDASFYGHCSSQDSKPDGSLV